ncbi:lysozyme [Janibacter limosus]|uniref:lysozyme n=1 Tax=Janibacter limosus TaxID=53458 RepID=A0A4P6MPG6_9MICO|nr:lysozyme [Janibacter limosus]QBF45254.1 lysozyme [Janibacter limosus]
MSRTTMTLAAAALTAVGLLVPTGAGAAPAERTPTAEARDAGVTGPGEAAMGWRQHDVQQTPKRSTAAVAATPPGVPGIDVSSWQGRVDWAAQWQAGKRFAYVKATEGSTYTSPTFGHQYTGSYSQGFIRGAYHFALPDSSSGTTQANHFVDHGGGWSADGKTLPGALDMEWNPYGAACYGKTQTQMRSWINAFLDRYRARTGRYPVIYTATSWWNKCVGGDTSFAAKSPLWLARYASAPGTKPAGWSTYSFWQYSTTPVDQNVWNGTLARLRYFATH